MTTEIFFDIETRPCDDSDLIARITDNVRPPATIKRQDTMAKWDAEERPKAVMDAIAKTSLDGRYGRICCIGWAMDDDEPQAIVSADEREVIMAWMSALDTVCNPGTGEFEAIRIIGHNVVDFDLTFLRKRCMVLGIYPTSRLMPILRRPSDFSGAHDTMMMWDASRDKRIGLDELCLVLGIPSPKADGIDGSQVASLFAAGEYDKIGEYCCGDVTATRRVYRAMTFDRRD